MNARRTGLLLALPAALTLASCSSSGGGNKPTETPNTTQSGGKGVVSASAGASAQAGTPTDAAGLAALLQTGVNTIKSAHLNLDVEFAGQSLAGEGDEQVAGGKLVASDIRQSVPQVGEIRIITVGGKTYAKIPGTKGSKPYSLVTTRSSDPIIKQIASTLDSVQGAASIGSVTAFTTAAKSVRVLGTESIQGTPTTRYAVVVDTTKLPGDYPGKDALVQLGVTTLPIEIDVDSQGRPVQVNQKVNVAGQGVETKIVFSKYDQPVHIAAPPADQINTD